MEVDTGSFRALTASTEQRLAALEAEVAELRQAVLFTSELGDLISDRAYERGRESILGRKAEPRPPRPRHLRVVSGGAR